MRLAVAFVLVALLAGCAGSAPVPAPAAAPAPKAAEQPAQAAPKPAAETKPAAESKPAAEPAKPAAQPAKPAAQPAKPAAEKPASGSPARLMMGAPPSASGVYVYTVALGKLLNAKVPEVTITVSEGAGAQANIKRISEGQVDFALASFIGLYLPYAGLDPAFKDKPPTDARALWVQEQAVQAWLVREDSGITSFEQLDGKDFNPGGQGGATAAFVQQLIFPVLGIKPRWYVAGLADGLAALKDRRIVGMGKATSLLTPDAVILDAMTSTKIRILSWTPEQVQKVKAKYPFLSTVDIPAGVYKAPWNEKPITTWQDGFGMYTLAKFSNDLAYKFTKVAIEDSKASDSIQIGAYRGMAGFDMVKGTLDMATVPLHAGAQKYLQEVGAKIPDHLKSPEAK